MLEVIFFPKCWCSISGTSSLDHITNKKCNGENYLKKKKNKKISEESQNVGLYVADTSARPV